MTFQLLFGGFFGLRELMREQNFYNSQEFHLKIEILLRWNIIDITSSDSDSECKTTTTTTKNYSSYFKDVNKLALK